MPSSCWKVRVGPGSLGKYEILERLGGGAMGLVYLARDSVLDREVALKTIRTELLDELGAPGVVARFRQEAMAAARLSHPGIVAIYEYGEEAGTAYIAMEYAPGEDVADYVAR